MLRRIFWMQGQDQGSEPRLQFLRIAAEQVAAVTGLSDDQLQSPRRLFGRVASNDAPFITAADPDASLPWLQFSQPLKSRKLIVKK